MARKINQFDSPPRPKIKNIHADDMCRGTIEQLQFGEGRLDFIKIFSSRGF